MAKTESRERVEPLVIRQWRQEFESGVDDYAGQTHEVTAREQAEILAHLDDVWVAAIEAAAQAQCEYCRTLGEPKENNPILTANGRPFWHEDASGIFMECKAGAIRNLKGEKA